MHNGVRDTVEQMRHNEADYRRASRYSGVGGHYASDVGSSNQNVNHTGCKLDTTEHKPPVNFSENIERLNAKRDREMLDSRTELMNVACGVLYMRKRVYVDPKPPVIKVDFSEQLARLN